VGHIVAASRTTCCYILPNAETARELSETASKPSQQQDSQIVENSVVNVVSSVAHAFATFPSNFVKKLLSSFCAKLLTNKN